MFPEFEFNMRGAHLQVPDNLNVTGRGLSPVRTQSPASGEDIDMLTLANSSRLSSMSEDDGGDTSSEEMTVLDGVRQMNQILVRQIETLRLKIKVDEKNYDQDKARLLQSKDSELQTKEDEIEELRESVTARDDEITKLTRAAEERDRTIQSKCAEIDQLKNMVKETKEYAQKMHKEMKLAKNRREKLELDPLYQQQNEEIGKLTQEVEMLRGSLATMESELQRALKIIGQQNEKLKSLDEERAAVHAKFREDLEKASKAMRQEVERMREVMRQNYDEMRNLREQNKAMHGDVRAIKEMLKATNSNQQFLQQDTLSVNPQPGSNYGQYMHGQVAAVPPKGPGRMVGANMSRNSATENKRVYAGGAAPVPPLRESSQFGLKSISGRAVGAGRGAGFTSSQSNGVDSSGYYSSTSTARLPVDPKRSQTAAASRSTSQTPIYAIQNKSNNNNGKASDGRTLPAICALKEGVPAARQSSGRGRPVVRRGSAVAKK